MIFAFLEGLTLSLKSLRLVCREWAELVTRLLFSIAFLDGFHTSWTKLRKLCLSRYGLFVKKIYWSPLVLYDDCLNREVWRHNYPNLLDGAEETRLRQMHESFCRVWHNSSAYPDDRLSSSINNLREEVSRLTNCQEIVINDNLDLETRCADGVTNRIVQTDPMLWGTTSTWARIPRISKLRDIPRPHGIRLFTMWNVLEAFRGLDTCTHLHIDLWETIFLRVCRFRAGDGKDVPFTNLHINLKRGTTTASYNLCSELVGPDHCLGQYYMEYFFRLFTNLEQLYIGSFEPRAGGYVTCTPEEPLRELDRTWSGSNEYFDYSKSSHLVNIDFNNFEEVRNHYGLEVQPPAIMPQDSAKPVPQDFLAVRFDEAMRNDMIIDLRNLVFYLVNLHEKPGKPLILRFSGHVFLYGMSEHVFRSTMAALDMHVSYEDSLLLYEAVPIAVHDRLQDDLKTSRDHDLVRWPRANPDIRKAISLWYSPRLLSEVKSPSDASANPVARVIFNKYPGDWDNIKIMWWPLVLERPDPLIFYYEYTERVAVTKDGETIHWIIYDWVDHGWRDGATGWHMPIKSLTRLVLQRNRAPQMDWPIF